MSVHSYLDISTGHLKHETFAGYLPYTDGLNVGTHKYGATVIVPDKDWLKDVMTGDMPEDLLAVLKYASEQGCGMINFDQDGESISELPFYDW